MNSDLHWDVAATQELTRHQPDMQWVTSAERWSRRLGRLWLVAALAWVLYLCVAPALVLPPMGYEATEARITSKMRRGSFMEPSFTLLLLYNSAIDTTQREMVLASAAVDFETYWDLEIGQTVPIYFERNEPTQWQLVLNPLTLGHFVLLALFVALGGLFLLLPNLLRLALRQDDFGY